jgi:hypothetical protein
LPLIGTSPVVPLVDQVFAFGQFPDAQRCVDECRHLGKIVVRMA